MQPLYAYRAAAYLEKVQIFPCNDCKAEEKIISHNRKEYPIFPHPDCIHEHDARCFSFCAHDLILVLLTREELLYLITIGRLIQKSDYEPPSIEEIYQRATAPPKEEMKLVTK